MLTITHFIYSLISDFSILLITDCDLIDKFNDMLIITHLIYSLISSFLTITHLIYSLKSEFLNITRFNWLL